MLNRIILFFAMFILVISGAFAAPELKFSLGAGGYFNTDFGSGAQWTSGDWRVASETPYVGGGAFLFFDATFAELSFGFSSGTLTQTNLWDYGSLGYTSYDREYSAIGLDIGLMGKFPIITIGSNISLYPLYGFSYRPLLRLTYEHKYNVAEDYAHFNSLWFKLGGGLDYSLTEKIYLRFGLTYGYKFPNKYDNDMVEFYDWYIQEMGIDNPDASTARIAPRVGHGFDIKLALAYKF